MSDRPIDPAVAKVTVGCLTSIVVFLSFAGWLIIPKDNPFAPLVAAPFMIFMAWVGLMIVVSIMTRGRGL